MLPWSTCGDTQGLVRIFIQPSSTEYNFTSQLTAEVSDGDEPPLALELTLS
jgi:hypothetical protein